MIYTVKLNSALDRFIVVEQLVAEDTTESVIIRLESAARSISLINFEAKLTE